VRIKNLGQSSEIFTVKGRSRRIKFEPEQIQDVRLRPGQSTTLNFQPLPSSPSLIGGEIIHSFRLQVQSAREETQILRGRIRNQAKFSLRFALILLLGLVSLLYISGKVLGNNSGQGSPKPIIRLIKAIYTPTPLPPHYGEVVYLTFDDGPSPLWTQQILDVLAKHDAKATFFVVGMSVKEYPELIHAEEKAGHSIAHHTWSHASLNGIGFDGFANQISLTNSVLVNDAVPCIRLPYADEGIYSEEYATQLGLEIIWWDVDSLDWSNPGKENIESNVLSNTYPGAIILFHDGGGDRSQTVASLETILKELSLQGYGFEALCKER